ncbi:hypothetical protein HN51_040095 [Arachis hypogaea]
MINILPSDFLSALTLLEELLASNALGFQKSLILSVSEISIGEIISSSRLSSLEVDFWHCVLYNLHACFGHCSAREVQVQYKLKKCTVVFCYSVERIVDTEQIDLSMLETLVLRYLIKLQIICREVTSSAFMRLKIINVEFCPNLKSLFLEKLLLQLSNLEEIRDGHCNKMEDLMRLEGEVTVMTFILQNSLA